MSIRSYRKWSPNFGNLRGIEFRGEHYLSKEKVMKVLGWDKGTVCDSAENDGSYGHFMTLTGGEAFYRDKSFLWIKKSVIEFYPEQISEDGFERLEKKVLKNLKLQSSS